MSLFFFFDGMNLSGTDKTNREENMGEVALLLSSLSFFLFFVLSIINFILFAISSFMSFVFIICCIYKFNNIGTEIRKFY